MTSVEPRRHVESGELGFDRHFYALARERKRADPAAARAAALQRAVTYLGPMCSREPGAWSNRFAFLWALAALGFASSRRRAILPLLIWAAQGAMMVPIFLIGRYGFPTEWSLVVMSAFALQSLAERAGARRALAAGAIALALCVAGSLVLARG